MKTTLFFILTSLFSINSSAQQDSTIFKGRIENKEFQVYIVMDFYKNNIIVPRQQIFGETSGYFGDTKDDRKWLITAASIKKNTATIDMVNDYGSEDLQATLTKNNDGTYTLKQMEGSTIKIARNRKWVKMPKTLIFTRK